MTTPTDKFIEEKVQELMGALHLLNARSWSDNAIMHDMPQKEAREVIRQALQAQKQKHEKAMITLIENNQTNNERVVAEALQAQRAEILEEIPQMKGTQEALDKLTIRPL